MRIYINGYQATREVLEKVLSEQPNIIQYCVSKKGNVILKYNDELANS